MGIPRVESCCCSDSLQTGTKIVAMIELVSEITLVGSLVTMAELLKNSGAADDSHLGEIDLLFGILVTSAVMCAVQLIITAMLLYGAFVQNPCLIKPWLVYSLVSLLMIFILMIFTIVIFAIADMTGFILVSAICGFIVMGIKFYYVVVVNSYNKKLMLESEQDYAIFSRDRNNSV